MRRTLNSLGLNTSLGFGLMIVLVIVNAVLAYWNIDQLHATGQAVAQTHEVVTVLDQLLAAVKDAETGQRGYLITDDPDYLLPYEQAVAVVKYRQMRLHELQDNASLTKDRLEQLDRLVADKFAELGKTIKLMDTEGFPAAQKEVLTDLGHNAMEKIRELVQGMRDEILKVLQERNVKAERNFITALATTLLAVCLSLALLGGSLHLIRRELAARRQAEAEAHLQREWHQTTLKSIGDAVIVTDADGRIKLLNPIAGTLTGWGDAAVGQPLDLVFAIFNERTRQPVESPADKVLREGVIVGLANHTLLRARNGHEIPIDDSGAPIRDQDGRITGVVLVFRDVTERRRTEAALIEQSVFLKETDRRKDEFLAMLAHELRNPLAPIHNALQIMKMEGPNGANFQWSLKVIGHQLNHLMRLVDDLLDVSRITQGKVKMQKEHLELATVVERAVETCRPWIEQRRHQLTVALGDKPLPLDADPVRLTQVFSNLLNNAAKYTEAGGQIALTATSSGKEAVVRIRDSGIGIAPEMLPRVFDLFAQADKTLAHASGGLGIGLTLVRRLVELHGGRIEAHSEGLGKGSEFVVRLPLTDKKEPVEAAPAQPAAVPTSSPCRRLLVIDDNRDSAMSLAILLRAAGNEVELAFDGPSAIAAARQRGHDAILLDIGLPGMDGFEVVQKMRQDPHLQQTPIIAMTGYGREEDRQQTRKAGFSAHLVKPVDLSVLESLLAEDP